MNTEFTATVQGTVSGGVGYPEPANHESQLAIRQKRARASRSPWTRCTGAYSQSPVWAFDESTIGHLTAVQYQMNASGLASNFTGAAGSQFPLSDGASVVVPAPPLPVATTSLSGTYTMPAGYTFRGKNLTIEAPTFRWSPCPRTR